MTDYVEVPFGGNKAEEKATLLLAAAEETDGFSAADVRTIGGAFLVPKELADAAGVEGTERPKRSLALREAEIPEGLVDTYRMGAGPTGTVDTNAGEGAQTGTVQNDKGEQKMGEPAQDNVLNAPKKSSRRRAKKSSESNSKSESEDKE